ncbi:unnamed protein product [Adineta steineri]|uniref:NADH dehydrogenase [ubiquinone] 1 alpha subcomplex subunit 9, mitochondrial n=1 Tax=Adineta steineri TaxID=433720 RepID=A0A816B8V2_9BILA|nr:unnamed protein product [Adineta steineri]CAF1607754.1 unnamed protein product [Adineta steineri]
MSKILITGGTGVLGRAISEIFRSNQTNFIVGSRNQNTKTYNNMNFNSNLDSKWVYLDLLKNEGFNKCLDNDIDTILHIATVNMQKINGQPGDIILTKNLLNFIEKKNIKHFVYISVVGIDKIPFSYYKGKLECEHLIKTSSIPYTILRSTNFHDFVDAAVSEFLQRPIRIIPKSLKAQPIQVEAVAMELNKIIQGSPLNTTYDIGGKSVYNMKEILDSLMKAHHENKLVINMPAMGKILKGFAKGYNTCNNIQLSSNTWEEYLSKKYHQ